MSIEITILNENQFDESADVIRKSFRTVANDFKLTKENAPTNPAFIEPSALKKMKEKEAAMFGVYEENILVGFVAIEKIDEKTYSMEKLAVIPEHRHKRYGEKLIVTVFDYVKVRDGEKIKIGIINENIVLKNWYKTYGFTETGVKKFEHLPFTVCFMERRV